TLRALDILNRAAETRIQTLTCFVAKVAAAKSMIEVRAAETARDLREQIELFERGARRCQRTDLLAAALLDYFAQTLRGERERAFPIGLLPHAVLAHDRLHQPILAIDPLIAEAVAIRDPRFVHFFVRARYDTHDAPAEHVCVDVGADAVVRRHERMLRLLPRASAIAERFVVERADRTEVDDVRRELMLDAALDERADLGHLRPADRAELLIALDLLREAHAASAVNASGHVRRHERADVLVLD